jgi:hypothetical protein
MSRIRLIGWTAFGVCLLGYGAFTAILVLNRMGHVEMRDLLIYGGAAAVVGEIGLWVAAGCLGWTLFKRRKALFDRMFGRKTPDV